MRVSNSGKVSESLGGGGVSRGGACEGGGDGVGGGGRAAKLCGVS